ncbi:MAG: MFS transporter [Peptococcaceae bacterium]|nr:MFS transporter [Peptococcaceae bacterium]
MPKSKLWTKNFILTDLANFFMALNFYLLMVTIAAFSMDHFNASPSAAGLAASIFIIGSLASRLFAGKYLEQIGRKRALMIGLTLSLIMSVLYFSANSMFLLYIIRFLHGAGFGFTSTAGGAIAAHYIPEERFGEGIAYYMLSITMATAVGPFLGIILLTHGDFNLLLICNALFAALSLLTASFLTNSESVYNQDQLEETRGLKLSNFIALSAAPISLFCSLLYICYSSLMSFIASYGREIQLIEATGFFFLLYSIAILASRPFVGRVVDKRGENYTMYPAIVIYTAGMFLLSRAHHSVIILLAGALIGLGFGAVQSTGQTVALKMVPSHRRGLGTSTFMTFCDFGTGAGPYLFGLIISGVGYRPMYLGISVFILLSSVLYYLMHGRRSRQYLS